MLACDASSVQSDNIETQIYTEDVTLSRYDRSHGSLTHPLGCTQPCSRVSGLNIKSLINRSRFSICSHTLTSAISMPSCMPLLCKQPLQTGVWTGRESSQRTFLVLYMTTSRSLQFTSALYRRLVWSHGDRNPREGLHQMPQKLACRHHVLHRQFKPSRCRQAL